METIETVLIITTASMMTLTMSMCYRYYLLRKNSTAILSIEREQLLV